MRLHNLEDEKVVSIHQRIVMEPTFKARVTLADERRLDFMSFLGGETELSELIDLPTADISDGDHCVRKRDRG